MRKLMLLAAMLAMVLVAAAPALAQDATAGDINTTVQYADCDTIQAAAATQYGGDAAALGDAAAASVANELGVSQESVVACLGSVVGVAETDDDGDGTVDETDGTEEEAAYEAAETSEGAASESSSEEESSSSEAATLPDTGGASLFTLGAGALLVGGGLLARRIFS